MIRGLHGRIAGLTASAVLVDLHGLILETMTSRTTLSDLGEVGEMVTLHTYLYVREDQLALYGFSTEEELALFEVLLSVSGIGPRVALAILSSARPEEIRHAIDVEDVALLSRVPGIGKKTASRIIFDLRGKLPEPSGQAPAPVSPADAEVLEALQALGYSAVEARDALRRAEPREGQTVEERVFAALQALAQG